MSPVPKGLVKIFTSTTVTLKGVHIMHSLKNTKYWQRAAGAFTSKAHSSQKLSFLDDDQITLGCAARKIQRRLIRIGVITIMRRL